MNREFLITASSLILVSVAAAAGAAQAQVGRLPASSTTIVRIDAAPPAPARLGKNARVVIRLDATTDGQNSAGKVSYSDLHIASPNADAATAGRGGARVAIGDVTGDGATEGQPHVKVFDGRTGAEVATYTGSTTVNQGVLRTQPGFDPLADHNMGGGTLATPTPETARRPLPKTYDHTLGGGSLVADEAEETARAVLYGRKAGDDKRQD